MNGVIYARYSCDHQREESIEGQVRECREFADRQNINIVGVYADKALTGKTDRRPQFQKMIKDSERKQFDVVIVWKLDRFSRNRYDSATYKHKLKKNGIKVLSAKENITDTPEGIILESMLEGMAEYYSAELAVKINRGLTENALKCKFNGGTMPLGYMKGPDQRLIINPETAPVVVEIFTRYAEGETIREIIASLNERGIKTTRGKPFRQNSLDGLLCNRVYLGYYKYRGEEVKDGVPAIITQELFDRVQARRARNKQSRAGAKADVEYLLTTKLYCGHCNSMMVGESGRSKNGSMYYYYKCGNHKRADGCHQRIFRKDVIEKLVIDRAIQIIHEDNVIDFVAECASRIQKQESTMLPVLEAQLREVQASIDNMIKAIEMGIITASTKERLESLEDDKKKILTAIATEKMEHPDIPKEFFEYWLSRLVSGDIESPEYRKMIADIFINAIYVQDEGLRFGLNFSDGVETIPLHQWNGAQCSDSLGYAPPYKNPDSFFLRKAFGFFLSWNELGL